MIELDSHLVLADGEVFEGTAIGAPGTTIGEAVFTTGMTGYQAVLTDPSYCGQIVTMTAPQMGNTGVNDEDDEAEAPVALGMVTRLDPTTPSNWRAAGHLSAWLEKRGRVSGSRIATFCLHGPPVPPPPSERGVVLRGVLRGGFLVLSDFFPATT